MTVTRPLVALVTLLGLSCRDSTPARATAVTHAATTHAGDPTTSGKLNIYSATRSGALSAAAERAKPLVYVPNSHAASVSVIDPASYSVIRTFRTGAIPQHVVPSWDLRRLWVLNNRASTVTPVDPRTCMRMVCT